MPLNQSELTTAQHRLETKLNLAERRILILERDVEVRDFRLDKIKCYVRNFCITSGAVLLILSLLWDRIGALMMNVDIVSFSWQKGFGFVQIIGVVVGLMLLVNGVRTK